MPEFKAFPKIARLNRDIVITEKLDGTNAAIGLDDEGQIWAQSRNKLLTVKDDNHGFANWVEQNRKELAKLGPGLHFGEWWGQGINKRYPGQVKTFSLFNVGRWLDPLGAEFNARYKEFAKDATPPPTCCSVVPVLYVGPRRAASLPHPPFDIVDAPAEILAQLKETGSLAQKGNLNPEGIIIFHTASQQLYKVTCEKDESPKGLIKTND